MDFGTFTIPDGTSLNFKQYYIKGEYTDSHFGTGKVIAPIEGNDESKNDRFYVMALNNIDSSTHYWYYNAYGKLDNIIAYTKNDFGEGRENTEYVNNKWNDSSLPWGAHNSNDMWGLIQDEIAEGWFVPSKSEWAAFGAAFDITSSNYPTFGLSNNYWSSSQFDTSNVYEANFFFGNIRRNIANGTLYVRLATTF